MDTRHRLAALDRAYLEKRDGIVRALVRRLGLPQQVAEDVVSEAYVITRARVAEGLVIRENAVGAYLWRAASHRGLDWLRRNREDPDTSPEGAPSTPADEALFAALQRCVEHASRQANELLRQHFERGDPLQDIARRAGVTPPAITRRLTLALVEIYACLVQCGAFTLGIPVERLRRVIGEG
jgi:RNA polymerase sigma factor (sigma-70 family)